jgi:hypothetical protein
MENNGVSHHCIVCKDIANGRYRLDLLDSRNNVGISAYVCRDCYNRFLSSNANEGMFRISRFLGWAKNKDRIRE